MAEEKDWALLANYSDKTLLRNQAAFCVGKILGMQWVPAAQPVELTLNGSYDGLYMLTEHVETGEFRVDVGEETDTSNGFLIELDERLDEELNFISAAGTKFSVKSDATPDQFAPIRQFIDEVEATTLNGNLLETSKMVDIESVVDHYIVQELMKNFDAFRLSTFMHRKQDGRLYFGPLWDFDIAGGNIDHGGADNPVGFGPRAAKVLIPYFNDPLFLKHVNARWKFLAQQNASRTKLHRDIRCNLG